MLYTHTIHCHNQVQMQILNQQKLWREKFQ